MIRWRPASFAILSSLIFGSSVFIVMSPGWKAVLAQVGYYYSGYTKPGAGTTFWLHHYMKNNVARQDWVNSAGPVDIPNRVLLRIAVENYCAAKGRGGFPKSRGYSDLVGPPRKLYVKCANGADGILTYLAGYGSWAADNTDYAAQWSDPALIQATATYYCKNQGQQLKDPEVQRKVRRHGSGPMEGPWLDAQCMKI